MADTKTKQKEAEERLSKKISSFDKMPDKCLICSLTFDKKNEKMVKEWRVVVKNSPVAVKLYCPKCWEDANSLLEYVNKQQMESDAGKGINSQGAEGYGAWKYDLEKRRKK